MKKLVLIVLGLLVLSGCSNASDNANDLDVTTNQSVTEDMEDEEATSDDVMSVAEYRKITPEEAKDMMVEGNIILDVRTEDEFDGGHIEGAMLLPVDDILAGSLDMLADKDQVILVYCRSGNRSGTAARALVEAGYTGVYDFGGITDWPYEVVN